MINTFHTMTPPILSELGNQYAYYREITPLKVVTIQDILEMVFAIPIITGIGYVIPFLGMYSIFGLILVVFTSWRLGNTISGIVTRYHRSKALRNGFKN